MTIRIVDIETAGTDPVADAIIEIASVDLRDDRQPALDPGGPLIPVPSESSAVHHLIDEELLLPWAGKGALALPADLGKAASLPVMAVPPTASDLEAARPADLERFAALARRWASRADPSREGRAVT
jgi:hypothetical protein